MRITMLLPDCDRQLGGSEPALRQMMSISKEHDENGGTLPSPFVRVTPTVTGHGETWYHPDGLFIIVTEHRPILLTTAHCATCGQKHMDAARMYLYGSWTDFTQRTYMRYVHTQIEAVGLSEPSSET